MTHRKYHNIKCSYNGIKFDSKKECNRFIELDMLQKAGVIKDLKLHLKYVRNAMAIKEQDIILRISPIKRVRN